MGQLQVRTMLCVATLAMLIIGHGMDETDMPNSRLQHWKPPSSGTIPQGPSGDSIRLGRLIFTHSEIRARVRWRPAVLQRLSPPCRHCPFRFADGRFAGPVPDV
jgi:hypothetical protein